MARRLAHAAAAIILLAAILGAASCGGGSGATPAFLGGTWNGALTLSYAGDGASAGPLTLKLDQGDAFASGSALWTPVGAALGIGGPIDGASFSFVMDFVCGSRLDEVILEGTVAGETMTVTSASGFACFGAGPDLTVSGAAGSLVRVPGPPPL